MGSQRLACLPRSEEGGQMSIISNAFGRVTLTGDDAAKFKNQVAYGRPKAAAKESVVRGIALSKELSRDGIITLKLKRP
jgi:hypothetical protein